jgi:hypothetical protein
MPADTVETVDRRLRRPLIDFDQPSSSSIRPSRQQTVTGDAWPKLRSDRAIASSAVASDNR